MLQLRSKVSTQQLTIDQSITSDAQCKASSVQGCEKVMINTATASSLGVHLLLLHICLTTHYYFDIAMQLVFILHVLLECLAFSNATHPGVEEHELSQACVAVAMFKMHQYLQ